MSIQLSVITNWKTYIKNNYMITKILNIISKTTIIISIIFIYIDSYSYNLSFESSCISPSVYSSTNQQILQKNLIHGGSAFLKNNLIFGYRYYDTIKYTKTDNFGKEIVYIGKQFISSELCGLGFSLLGAIIGSQLAPKNAGIGSLGYGLMSMYCGYTIGSSLGTYLSGNNSKYYGSYSSSLVGAIIGAYAGFRLFDAFNQKGFGSISLVLCAPIGSIIGFNIFRKSIN
jgi:hypothetical protein